MIREKFGLNEEDGKLMAKVARRSHQINAVYTWEKFQAMGYLWTMIPVINKMYDTEEERIAEVRKKTVWYFAGAWKVPDASV